MAVPAEVTSRQRRALDALLLGTTLEAAAASAGVSARTLRRWRAEPPFAARLRDAQDQAFEFARNGVRAAALDAVEALREVVRDRAGAASARVSAAKCILDVALRSREVDELVARVDAMEQLTRDREEARAHEGIASQDRAT